MISTKNTSALIALSLLWASQVTALAYMLSGVWFAPRPGGLDFLPEYASALGPQVNLPLYITFIAAAAVIYAGAVAIWRLNGFPADAWQRLWRYEIALAAVTAVMVGAVYQTIIYDNSPQLGRALFWVGAVLSAAGTVFWPELTRGVAALGRAAPRTSLAQAPGWVWDALIMLGLVAVVFVPDVRGMLALMFIGEQLHHMDYFAMSPGVGAFHGLAPYADVMSQYGLGMPVLIARLASVFGGFDYEPVMRILIVGGTVYFPLLYVFLKRWLKSRRWALTGTLASFGILMLHFGVSPVVWIYPSTTPWRLCGDIVFFMLLLSDVRSPRLWKAAAAGVWAGFAAYLMTSTGTALGAAYGVYLLWRSYPFRGNALPQAAGLALAPLLSFFICVVLTAKGRAFEASFWQHLIEYVRYFSSIHAGGVLPIYESLKYRNYGVFLLGVSIPIIYLTAILWFMSCLGRGRGDKELIVPVLLAVYGLMSYTYFVVRSAQTSYCPVGLAAVWILCWAGMTFARQCPASRQHTAAWAALGAVIFMIVTNHNYMAYPNILNVTRNPFTDKRVIQRFPDRQGYYHHQVKRIEEGKKLPLNSAGEREEHILTEDDFASDAELRRYFEQGFDFSKDAAMIKALVPAGEPAAVVSSFETKLLVQSGRKPYFYHIPLTASQPMRVRSLPPDSSHSPHFVEETIAQLQKHPPGYVFVENILLTEPMPQAVRDTSPKIMAIVEAIRSEGYRVVQKGEFLSALTKGK